MIFTTNGLNNVNAAIAEMISDDLYQLYPNLHVQAYAFSHRKEIPPETWRYGMVVFSLYQGHRCVIKIDHGEAKVQNHTKSIGSRGLRTMDPNIYKFKLEDPEFPQVLYDKLSKNIRVATEDCAPHSSIKPFLFEVRVAKAKGRTNAIRHLTHDVFRHKVKLFCGREALCDKVTNMGPSEHFLQHNNFCWNCRSSKLFKGLA